MGRILIVDDEPGVRMLYADELSDEGHEVFTNGGDSQVIDLIHEKRPDLIIMDLRLGQRDGLDLLREIRMDYRYLPVILCTAHPDFGHRVQSSDPDYFVTKNSDLKELKRTIRGALEASGQGPLEGNERAYPLLVSTERPLDS
jgi:DNA-binding response OmpR family regulator